MATPTDDIIIKDEITYDLAGGDTILLLGESLNTKISLQIVLDSVNQTGIRFVAVQSADGTSWNEIKINNRILDLYNQSAAETLSLNTDLFYQKAIGVKIENTGGTATGTAYIYVNLK